MFPRKSSRNNSSSSSKNSRTNTRAQQRRTALIEDLETRVLLSAVTHFSIIAHPGNNRTAAVNAITGLTPTQIRTAYGFNSITFGSTAGDGSGQTIAIIDAYNDPTVAADLHAFDAAFGLPDPSLTVLNQSGGTSLPSTDPSGRGDSWALEIALDVEWAHAAAPGAKILLLEASSANDSDLLTAVKTARAYTGVSAVSMSWGGDESSSDTADNQFFTTPAGHNGVTFLSSSGDDGAYGGSGSTKVVGYPAASPNVVAVGGTTLNVSSSGSYISETGWGSGTSSFNNGGSGGGISTIEAQPAYQHGVVTQSTTKRTLPDVSMDADPNTGVAVYDSWDSPSAPWMQIGGTSLASPLWAGVIAVIDQGRVASGQTTLDGATQTLPKLYALSASDFHDVTSGNNGYAASTGYDLVTGRGTPILSKLVPDMVGVVVPTTPTPSIGSFVASPAAVVSGATLTLTASNVAEVGGSGTISSVKFYRETNGTSGLQTATDTLLGTGTLTTVKGTATWTLSTATTAFTAGSYTYYAVATDTASVSSTASTIATVAAPTFGSFAASPASVNLNATVTLTASTVTEAGGGTISSVKFYRESDSTSGLQPAVDTTLAAPTNSGTTWTLSFNTAGLAAGTYTFYAVATDAVGISTTTSTTLTILPAAPNNDNFANAAVLTGSSLSATGSNINGTKESREPTIAGNAGGKSVWWTWTAPVTGVVTLTTAGSSFDTLLGVYTGTSVSALSLVASNDDTSSTNLTSTLAFKATAGVTYKFAVDGYNAASGSIVLNLSQSLPPANDNFLSAASLTGSSASWLGTTVGASREKGEPAILANAGGASVWFTWTAPKSGLVTLSTAGSSFDTMLAAYTGASVSALTLVASNDDVSSFDLTSQISFNAVAGVTYKFQVDGYNGASGTLALTLSQA